MVLLKVVLIEEVLLKIIFLKRSLNLLYRRGGSTKESQLEELLR